MASGSAQMGGFSLSDPQYGGQRTASSNSAMAKPVYMNGFVEDAPNNYWDWHPSSTFMENPQHDTATKSTNKNMEQGRPLQTTPTQLRKSTGRRHTPATFPRTKYLGSGREKSEMESLRQHLTFSDFEEKSVENGIEGASANFRSVSQAGSRHNEGNGKLHLGGGEGGQEDAIVNDMPNRNQIVGRLMQIREYIKQANFMLSNIGEPGMASLQNDQIVKLGQLQEHLKEQERGYLILLERMLGEDTSVNKEGRSSQNSGESFATSVAESASINVDARSDISEASTVGTYTAKTRPRIESTLGNYTSDCEIMSDVEKEEDIMSVDSEVTGSFGLDTGELHEQYSSLLAKYDPKEDPNHYLRDSSSEDLPNNGIISSSNNSQNDVGLNDQMETLVGLQQQHDLLKKMLQQQEELRNLQSRQSSLMKLQEQIESRLAANETSTEATPSEVSQKTEDSKTVTETSTVPEREPPSETESERYKLALQDLRKRTLMRMLNEDRDQRLQKFKEDAKSDLRQREREQVQLMNAEHKELQEKLQHLQQKKEDMDLLLNQLHSMAAGAGVMKAESSIDPASETEGSQAETNLARGGGDGTEPEGATVGTDSLIKLQEVRHRLTELRDLVQEYQDTTQEMPDNVHDANYEDPELMSNLRKLERGELIGRYRGIHTNNHNQASTQTVAPPLINQTEDDTQGTPSVSEDETETENESEQSSSIPVAWADDPELREKFRKLETAKQKLRELQKLVSIVQESPEVAMGLPDDLAELAMSLTEEVSEVTGEGDDDEEGEEEDDDDDEQSNRDEESGVAEVYSELSEGEVPEQTREAYYEAKMRQQRRELEKLMEERGRLLNVQRQLKELNQRLPPISMINNFTQVQPQMGARSLPPVNTQDMLTPSRDEVYAEMRRHKILQEELRQKKRELAALVAKVKRNKTGEDDINDLEDNDLFRVSMRSADVTAAATWGGSSQMSDGEDDEDYETNDAYPIDGAMAEEEEEEEEGNSIAMTSDTYTVEEPRFNPERPSILPNESDYDESLLEMHGIRYPGKFPRQIHRNPRQENLRAAEDLIEDMSQYSEDHKRLQLQVDHLQEQLSESVRVTQALVKDQQTMMNMLYQNSTSGSHPSYQGLSPSPVPGRPRYGASDDPRLAELLHNYDLRLQHQQLMLNLNNAYNDLFKQQEALENFYKNTEELEGEGKNVNTNNSGYKRMEVVGQEDHPYQERDTYSPFGRPGQGSGSYQRKYGLPEDTHGLSFNLAPTFPPEFSHSSQREQNYSAPESDAYLKGYNEYSRQQASRYTNPYETTGAYHVPPNSSQRSFESNDLEASNTPEGVGQERTGLSQGNNKKGLHETREVQANVQSPAKGNIPRLDIDSLLRKTERQRQRKLEKESRKGQLASGSSKDNTAKRGNSSSLQAKSKMAARSKLTDANFSSPARFRPGLSSHLSGTAFLDTASMASTMSFSSMPGELDQEGMRYLRPGDVRGDNTQRSVMTQSEAGSEAGSEYSLFEALRESIYSEVATLISQNESRPHFLIELFRELQMLSTDYLRQRALYALQDLVSKFLTDDTGGQQNVNELTKTYLNWPYSTVSEHTPSESFITSEEEEIKAQLYGQRPDLHPTNSKGSLSELQYDYVENVESASSMSTPPSVGGPGDFGFANEELGNTVIHLDKALQRMREYERMKAEAEASGGTSSSAVLSKVEDNAPTASDVTSNSSAQDMGSESSFSDLPYPRIDTRQLDLQIKSIMQEVIPYLKEHMDDVCSTQLLAYIRRLVMNLARQRDDSREFVRFFNRQLGSILEDSLSKFSGRKMRECGEDLLVDISEILFNELAFFRLMQDLDTAGDKLRMEIEQEEKKDTTEAEESKGEEDDDDDDDEEDEEEEGGGDEVSETTATETGQEDAQDDGTTDNTTEDDEENEALAKTDDTMATVVEVGSQLVQEAMESAMTIASKFEAEELGNDRDDMFAAEVMISENEEDSEPVDDKGMKIELSMSESKAVTYLGSEEDDNDQDEVSQNNDETETSLGMSSTKPVINPTMEENPSATEEEAAKDGISEEVTTPQQDPSLKITTEQQENQEEANSDQQDPLVDPVLDHKDLNTESKVVQGEMEPQPASSDDSVNIKDEKNEQREEEDEAAKKTETGGELKDANENEVTVDDLPAKLTSLSQMEIEAKMEEEASGTDTSKAVLESMAAGENQLAGDGEALPEPEGMPPENGVLETEPAST